MVFAIQQLPDDALTRAAIYAFFSLILATNVLWIIAKIVLWTHGYRRWFASDDFRDLKALAGRESDSTTRRQYDILRYSFHTCFALLFIVPLFLLALGSVLSHIHL